MRPAHLNIAACAALAAVVSGASAQNRLIEHRGAGPQTLFGFRIAALGDVDGDGIPDLAATSIASAAWDGRADVLSGRDGHTIHTLFGRRGAAEAMGTAVASVGDVDGDGRDDFAIGISGRTGPRNEPSAGAVEVYSGATARLIRAHLGDGGGDLFGSTVAGVGDMNGDGTPDYVVGAPENGEPIPFYGAGYARAFSGRDGATLFTWRGTRVADEFGNTVSALGDTDGDGRPEVLVGSYLEDMPNGAIGSARVYSGKTGSRLLTLAGEPGDEHYCMAAQPMFDFDRDGVADIAVGAPNPFALNRVGRVYVHSGRDGRILHTLHGAPTSRMFGRSIAFVDDVDLDGEPDVLVGDPGDLVGSTRNGSARIHSLRSGRLLMSFLGSEPGASFGDGVELLGDTNGDGRREIAINAYTTATRTGATTVWSLAPTARLGRGCGVGSTALDATAARPGALLHLFATGQLRNASGAVLASAVPRLPLRMTDSCSLYLDRATTAPIAALRTDAAGRAAIALRLPADPTLVGAAFALQAGFAPTRGPLGLDLTNGVYVTVVR